MGKNAGHYLQYGPSNSVSKRYLTRYGIESGGTGEGDRGGGGSEDNNIVTNKAKREGKLTTPRSCCGFRARIVDSAAET